MGIASKKFKATEIFFLYGMNHVQVYSSNILPKLSE